VQLAARGAAEHTVSLWNLSADGETTLDDPR
jgi:hypothetical protein